MLPRSSGSRPCLDCGGEFTSWPGDTQERCGNCGATTHLPRCGEISPVYPPKGIAVATCQRAVGHTGHHTYGRKRS